MKLHHALLRACLLASVPMVGLAANESIATGQPVDVAGILETTP